MTKVSLKVEKEEDKEKPYTCVVKNAIERCYCGGETFYVSKARDLYCAHCRKKVPNTTVYTNNFTKNSGKETIQ